MEKTENLNEEVRKAFEKIQQGGINIYPTDTDYLL